MTTAINTGRWVAGYTSQYDWAQCSYCGRAQSHDCKPVACLLCGTVQCFGGSSSRGTCRLCYHGFIPGWSRLGRERCGRKGCEHAAVTEAPRVGQVCAEHAKVTKLRLGARSITLTDYAAERIAHRDSGKGRDYDRWRWVA